MKKIFIFVFTLFIGLFAFSGWCGNILEDAQYETIKKLNGEFFEEYKKLSAIQTRLLKLSSYDTTFRYADTWLDSATEHVTFVLNLWGYEYGFIKWLPAIRDEFLFEFLSEMAKRFELLKKKTLLLFNPVEMTITQLSQPKYLSMLDTDIVKELEKAQNTMEAGIKLIDKIAAQFQAKVVFQAP